MRLEAVVVAVRSAEDVVLTTSPRAHGPSNWVGVDPRLGLVLWEDLLDRKAGMGDALDAPATEVDVGAAAEGAAVVGVGAAVAVDGSLEQEDRALAHDGDDRCREAVAQAQREKASAELRNARWVEEGNVDTGSEEDEEDDVERRAEAEAAVEVDEREDVVVILLVEVCRLATKRGVDVYYLEVLDPCLSTIYVWKYWHT